MLLYLLYYIFIISFYHIIYYIYIIIINFCIWSNLHTSYTLYIGPMAFAQICNKVSQLLYVHKQY